MDAKLEKSRSGRPPLEGSLRRSRTISVSLTQQEWQALMDYARDATLSSVARKLLLQALGAHTDPAAGQQHEPLEGPGD